MRTILVAMLLLSAGPAWADDPVGHPVRIGVITDMNGALSAQTGPGAVLAVQMAAEDCQAAECAGMTIEVLSADHQNKADVAVGIVRDWFDNKGVDAVADIVQATVQIAIQHEVAARNKVALFSGGTARLTSEDCAPRDVGDVDVGHLWAGRRDHAPDRQAGQQVVLHHGRLRVWQVAADGRDRAGAEGRAGRWWGRSAIRSGSQGISLRSWCRRKARGRT